jgi:hypothetical protein
LEYLLSVIRKLYDDVKARLKGVTRGNIAHAGGKTLYCLLGNKQHQLGRFALEAKADAL